MIDKTGLRDIAIIVIGCRAFVAFMDTDIPRICAFFGRFFK